MSITQEVRRREKITTKLGKKWVKMQLKILIWANRKFLLGTEQVELYPLGALAKAFEPLTSYGEKTRNRRYHT